MNSVSQFRAGKNFNFLFLFLGILLIFNASASAQDVVLNPGTISGQVQVGSETISRINVWANGPQGLSASKTITATGNVVNYNITVNVPEGTIANYSVWVRVWTDGNWYRMDFPSQVIPVEEGQTSTADFILSNPGIVQGTLTIENGGVLRGNAQIDVQNGPYALTSTNQTTRNSQYRLPVHPGTSRPVRCWGYIEDTYAPNGRKSFNILQTVDISAGQTKTVDCFVPFTPTPAPELGSIAGNITVTGPAVPVQDKIWHSLTGPTNLNQYIFHGPYTIDNLPVGNYYLRTWQNFNDGGQWLYLPYSAMSPSGRGPYSVLANQTTQQDINYTQSFITGKINLSGSLSSADITLLQMQGNGIFGNSSYGGSAWHTNWNPTEGEYELVVAEGEWTIPRFYMYFRDLTLDPETYLNTTINMDTVPDESIPIATSPSNPGVRDYNFGVGEVIVKFRIAGDTGLTLSQPQLSRTCDHRDADGNLIYRYWINAFNQRQSNVEIGQVRFFAPEGSCNLNATALVNGTRVSFGDVLLPVVPGTKVVVDIGGPTLTVQSPTPNLVIGTDSVTVSGLATDDVEVASVTVNGIAATLTSTNNPNDDKEVSWSVTLNGLALGPNEIETVASDTAVPAKTASDTRTVFYDLGPPTVSFTPADGTVVAETGATTPVLIEGLADDDAGIKTITINGVTTSFQTTSNASQPNEVSFSKLLNLPLGDHNVEVVATDVSGRSTTETHQISVSGAPTADAGNDQQVDEGTLVTLDGSGSQSPGGLPLTYSWSQLAGPTVSLDLTDPVHPTFMAPYVSSNVTLTFELIVYDGSTYSEADTVDITVVSINHPPVADAGDDSSIKEGALAILDGSNSHDPESDPVSYQWTQIGGPAVTLSNADTSSPSFTAPVAAGSVVVLQLQVSDGKESSTPTSPAVPDPGIQDDDIVSVVIVENSAPIADAGSDQTADEGTLVGLDGSNSSDPDHDGITYHWAQISGQPVTLSDTASATPNFPAPAVNSGGEAFEFELTVTDDDPVNPKSSSDRVIINVRNINDPPSCDLAVASLESLWPPNHKMIGLEIDGVMDTDVLYNDITLQITSISQDEPVNGTGDGDTSPDAIIQPSDPRDSVLIRSERSGNENGRVYQINFSATDGFEGCTGSVQVVVPHSRKSGAGDDGQIYDSTLP